MNIEDRLSYNREIVRRLSELIEQHPHQRFGQLLINSEILIMEDEGWVYDPFYEESRVTLNRILNSNILKY